MSIRNRELSQFGSFIYINDSTKSVGIATTATPYVGIGTALPDSKLHVVGDTSISGILTVSGSINASQILLNNEPIINGAVEKWASGTGSDIYRQNGNVSIGASSSTEKLTVFGNVSATRFISTTTTGTSPFSVSSQTLVTNLNSDFLRGKVPPAGTIVGTTDSQTLTNKTLSNPLFEGTGVGFNGSASGITIVAAAATASGSLTLPTTGGSLISTNDSSVISSGMIINGTIANSDISNSAAISYSKLNLSNSITNSDIVSGAAIENGKLQNSTISGVSLGGNLSNLTAGSFITYSSGTTYNGSSAITIGVAGTTANTSNTIVVRNSSGDFSAGTISCANINTTFNVSSSTGTITNLSSNGVNVSGVVTATTFVGSGSSLTSLNASNISSGTVPTARLASGTANATTFLRGDQTWAVVTAGIAVTDDTSTNSTRYLTFTDATSGSVTAQNVSSTKLTFNPSTGTLTVVDLNSTSDINLKTNINTVENALDTVSQLRGVSFDWKETGKSSYGVIAQELEEVLPELVGTGETKTVNYSGIIGVLVEAIKELKAEIEDLKNSK